MIIAIVSAILLVLTVVIIAIKRKNRCTRVKHWGRHAWFLYRTRWISAKEREVMYICIGCDKYKLEKVIVTPKMESNAKLLTDNWKIINAPAMTDKQFYEGNRRELKS
jgi:hypothetical protein